MHLYRIHRCRRHLRCSHLPESWYQAVPLQEFAMRAGQIQPSAPAMQRRILPLHRNIHILPIPTRGQQQGEPISSQQSLVTGFIRWQPYQRRGWQNKIEAVSRIL